MLKLISKNNLDIFLVLSLDVDLNKLLLCFRFSQHLWVFTEVFSNSILGKKSSNSYFSLLNLNKKNKELNNYVRFQDPLLAPLQCFLMNAHIRNKKLKIERTEQYGYSLFFFVKLGLNVVVTMLFLCPFWVILKEYCELC